MYSILKWVFMKYPNLINYLPREQGTLWSNVIWEEQQVRWLKEER